MISLPSQIPIQNPDIPLFIGKIHNKKENEFHPQLHSCYKIIHFLLSTGKGLGFLYLPVSINNEWQLNVVWIEYIISALEVVGITPFRIHTCTICKVLICQMYYSENLTISCKY